jgi:hypothetical protein
MVNHIVGAQARDGDISSAQVIGLAADRPVSLGQACFVILIRRLHSNYKHSNNDAAVSLLPL